MISGIEHCLMHGLSTDPVLSLTLTNLKLRHFHMLQGV